jgi:hypothetical protein
MKSTIPWLLVLFFFCFFVAQRTAHEQDKQQQQKLRTIDGQTELLSEWLALTPDQENAYLAFRLSIVNKEKEFEAFRKKDIEEFYDKTKDSDMSKEEWIETLKQRHLSRLKDIKGEELDLWSNWIETLTWEQRLKYLTEVIEKRMVDASWYDRDIFESILNEDPDAESATATGQ